MHVYELPWEIGPWEIGECGRVLNGVGSEPGLRGCTMKPEGGFSLEAWAAANRCVAGDAVEFKVRAEHHADHVAALLVKFELAGPREDVFCSGDQYWLDFALGPKRQQTDVRFVDHWRPDRFRRAGSIFLVPPGECLQLRCLGGAQSSIICRAPPQSFPEWMPQSPVSNGSRLEAILDIGDANVHQLLARLAQEMQRPGLAGDLLIEMMISQLLLEISSYWTSAVDQVRGGLSDWQWRKIRDRVNAPGSLPTLTELAKLCEMSPRHLTRAFRASRGCSIGAFVKQRQFALANQLLSTSRPVKEIASLVGFSSASAFIHAYAKDAGITPHQFRLQRSGAAPPP
ncbi:helix-turn-helix transcriptional regulator [Phenylobacterium sp. LjRoot225]|uniref:helix-turn-helix transcriptional regulator n=1 Tax=Phenylobacterium sp. LjRoot225 TaxID=3342285 RepID=UPI003ECD1B7F